jgi:hypothetical protein
MTMSFEDPRVDELEKNIERLSAGVKQLTALADSQAAIIRQQSALLALQDEMMDAASRDAGSDYEKHHLRIGNIAQPTDVIGEAQGYRPLPISQVVDAEGSVMLLSAWEFTPEQREMVAEGAPLILSVCGGQHPPVAIMIGVRQAQAETEAEQRSLN